MVVLNFFCLKIRPHDFDKGNKDKDEVENSDEEGVKCSSVHPPPSSAARILHKECNRDDYRHPPTRKSPPRAEDFIMHFVGDEGEEKGGRREENLRLDFMVRVQRP